MKAENTTENMVSASLVEHYIKCAIMSNEEVIKLRKQIVSLTQKIKSMESIFSGDAPTKEASNQATQQTLSFGQKLVGLQFNPSGDGKVNRAKEICAELADMVNDHWENKEHSRLENQLYDHTIGEILNAQMNAVKLLTLKY